MCYAQAEITDDAGTVLVRSNGKYMAMTVAETWDVERMLVYDGERKPMWRKE